SHELRTPLNSLLILSQVLSENREGNLSGKQIESLALIHSSGKELLFLINEILDLAKVETGTLELKMEDLSVRELAAAQERYFLDESQEKDVSLDVEVSEDLPEMIRTDPQRLDQILKSLLSNALKFTDPGGKVMVRFYQDVPAMEGEPPMNPAQTLAVSVEDTGIGIAGDKQEKIFEAFMQADGTRSRKYGGSGLGLSISRAFAELLGGRIFVESEEGQGSTFTLYLPYTVSAAGGDRARPAAGPVAGEADPVVLPDSMAKVCRISSQESMKRLVDSHGFADENPFDIRGRKALIIDDDMRTVFILSNALEERGVIVLIGRNKREGVMHLERQPDTDLVFVDPDVLGERGLSAVREVELSSRDGKRRIIAMVKEGMPSIDIQALSPGVDGVLMKPIDVARVLSLMRSWVFADTKSS
ncbi:MAG: ATP-binding protein, partial [Planctomycetota bacterium]